MNRLLRAWAFLAAVAALSSVALEATCGGGGGGGMGGFGGGSDAQTYQVPWKFFHAGTTPSSTQGLTLYWFPASAAEIKASSLRVSRDLSLYAAGCIALYIADGHAPVAQKLAPTDKAPLAVLVDGEGNIIGRSDPHNGKLRVADVEKLVRDELGRRDDALAKALADAKAKEKAGDKDGAVKLLQSVWGQRCLFPRRGRDAGKELKKLGVVADDPSLSAEGREAVFSGPVADHVVGLMQRGFQAELAADYPAAQSCYEQAHGLDPADPTPARYLGELYRHYTGEWAKARRVFDEILAEPADPLSRAVALHGLGKMTIHEGHYLQGLHLMEQSTDEFPLALAYRNLAVFWNSECDPVKANAYVRQALALDPDDAYNVVFAAVYLAQNGQKEEALKVAREHADLLPASYNLAAIYAQAGDTEQALKFLERHFYGYERYRAVRGEEMMEARVDEMFAGIWKDLRFQNLTAMADGMLPTRMTAH